MNQQRSNAPRQQRVFENCNLSLIMKTQNVLTFPTEKNEISIESLRMM